MAKQRIRKEISGVLKPPVRRDPLPPNKTEKDKTKYDRKKEKIIKEDDI